MYSVITGNSGTSLNIVVQVNAVPHSTSAARKRSPSNYGPLANWSVSVFSMVSQSP